MKKKTTDAVKILKDRYITSPERQESVDAEARTLRVEESLNRWRRCRETSWMDAYSERPMFGEPSEMTADKGVLSDELLRLFDPTPLTADVLREHGFVVGGGIANLNQSRWWLEEDALIGWRVFVDDSERGDPIATLRSVGDLRRWLQLTEGT